MSLLQKGFSDIEKHYKMARAILEAKGNLKGNQLYWESSKIRISGSPDNLMLSIDFDDRANTGRDFWSQPLNISSIGSIERVSQPHLSQAEAKEGRSKMSYIPWYSFLNREYQALFGKQWEDDGEY
jgi:hypothetical protein